MPVEKRHFQDIRIELLSRSSERVAFTSGSVPTKIVLYFRSVSAGNPVYKYQCRRFQLAFIMKDPLVQYYLLQVGRRSHSGISPIYSVPHFVQCGHGKGSFLRGLFRLVRPVLWSGVKAVGRETVRTGGKILSELADNTAGDVKPRHIIAKHVTDSAQTLIQKLRRRGRKRAAVLKSGDYPRKSGRGLRGQRLQKGTFLHRTYHSVSEHGCGRSVCKHQVRNISYQTYTVFDYRDDRDRLQTDCIP